MIHSFRIGRKIHRKLSFCEYQYSKSDLNSFALFNAIQCKKKKHTHTYSEHEKLAKSSGRTKSKR
jgi:hypothetical protein